MVRRIGQAADYYRCRVLDIVENQPQALEWRDDVLYREAAPPSVDSAERFLVQILHVDTDEAHDVKPYRSQEAAGKKKALIEEDLSDLTRSEFSKKYGLPWD